MIAVTNKDPHTSQHVEAPANVDLESMANRQDDKITFQYMWENKRVLGWCLLIFLLPVNFGYEASTVGNLLAVTPFLEEFGQQVNGEWVVSAQDQQILNAATTIGLFVSAFATGFISDRIGRKKTIIIACILCVAGVIVQYFSKSIMQIFGGKIVACFGFGLGHSLGPVFVAELAPVKMRGTCLALVNTMIVIGQWLNSLAVFASDKTHSDSLAWRIPIITQIIPPGLLLLGLPFLAESPSWLIMHGRHEEAAQSFRRFNGPNFDVDTAMTIMTVAVAKEQEISKESGTWLQCFRGSDGRRTLIICMVYISQQFIGVNFISGYLTYYFRLAGVQNPIGIAQAAFAVQLFGNMCSWPLIDRVGRRPMIVGGCFVMTAALLVIGGIGTLENNQKALMATVSLMTIWGFLYQCFLGSTSYSVGGETPSNQLRQKTYSINIMSATAVSCMTLQVMPYLINPDQANLGAKICFVFFGLSVPMCVYLYFCLPEMKGRNYLELQEMFQKGVPAREFKTYQCECTLDTAETKAVDRDD
ncbi:maltose permease [Colletotrichum plurivorum]|uniref:Maltose permease n=1 Tax=Colletotrichum plurivorum TaxID=2175906 RepID=A0A8H6NPY6_9PEZI|nr:maltose permease [Colletotrichum plurivorum]